MNTKTINIKTANWWPSIGLMNHTAKLFEDSPVIVQAITVTDREGEDEVINIKAQTEYRWRIPQFREHIEQLFENSPVTIEKIEIADDEQEGDSELDEETRTQLREVRKAFASLEEKEAEWERIRAIKDM